MVALDSFWNFLSRIPWYAWVPILGIIAGAIQQIISRSHRHEERMEMLRHGIDPRDPTER